MTDLDRRQIPQGAAMLPALVPVLAALGLPDRAFAAEGGLDLRQGAALLLRRPGRSRPELASEAYVPPEKPAPEVTSKLGYEQLGKIKFSTENALWANGPGRFR